VTVSVIIPAHNEERLLPRALSCVDVARERADTEVEVVVVANRCDDATIEIGREAGALIVESLARSIAAVRNAGVAASRGETVITIDADSQMHPNAVLAVSRELASGRVVGGGTRFQPERSSTGIALTLAAVRLLSLVTRTAGVMYWCARADFDAIGGFNEALALGEDVDFARRLRRHGRRSGRRFVTLRDAPVTISTRKFDRFGDWHMFKMLGEAPSIIRAARGVDSTWADNYFFDFDDSLQE
jgi:glycosyltransferase involved in cell wall biosynthesis